MNNHATAPKCDCQPWLRIPERRAHLSDCAVRMPHPPRPARPAVKGGQGHSPEEVIDSGAAVAWAALAMTLLLGGFLGAFLVRVLS